MSSTVYMRKGGVDHYNGVPCVPYMGQGFDQNMSFDIANNYETIFDAITIGFGTQFNWQFLSNEFGVFYISFDAGASTLRIILLQPTRLGRSFGEDYMPVNYDPTKTYEATIKKTGDEYSLVSNTFDLRWEAGGE